MSEPERRLPMQPNEPRPRRTLRSGNRRRYFRLLIAGWLAAGAITLGMAVFTDIPGPSALSTVFVWVTLGAMGLILARVSDYRVSREAVPDLILAFVPAGMGAVAMLLVGSRSGTLRFHEIAAQVLAVLFLALVFQAKAFDLRNVHIVVDGLYIMLTLLLIAAGEYSALESVFLGRPANGDVVVGALATALMAVLLRSAVAATEQPRADHRDRDQPR